MNDGRLRAALGGLIAMTIVLRSSLAGARAPNVKIPQRNISIVINGERLSPRPAPRIVSGRVLVPIVRIFGALAIPVQRFGRELVARAPNHTVRLTQGSRRAFIDGRPLMLDVAPVRMGDTTYVPLRFVVDALAASVAYDSRAQVVRIASLAVRREAHQQTTETGKIRIFGTLTAVDLLSEPPSLTVTYHGSVRTIAINSSAKIVLADVVARTEQPAKLGELHVGDAVSVTVNRDGRVELIEDRYGSRTGTIAAVSSSALVLDNGRVFTPDRTTTIVLNGQPATLGDLRVGDRVTQRMNPQTGESRELIAERDSATPAPAATAARASAPAILAFTAEPLRPLRLGEKFTFTLKGTPGARASYDLGTFLLGQPLHEDRPGVYQASLAVTAGMNFAQVAVTGHLSTGGEIVTQQAQNKISAATIAPQITDIAPQSGQVVNNNMPSIYATFDAPTELGIDPKSVVLKVNGKDVTASVTRTSSFVTYIAGTPLPDGPVSVSVAVADFAGNEASRAWTFTIQTR